MTSDEKSLVGKTGSVTLVIDDCSKSYSNNGAEICLDKNEFSFIYFGVDFKDFVKDEDEYVSVYLKSHCYETYKFKGNVFILNRKEEKLYTKEISGTFECEIREHRYSLMPHSRLNSYRYLFFDRLTLLCEIEILENEPNSYHTIRKDFYSLSEDFKSLLIDGKFTDATLVVGLDGKEFRVHKNILAARSTVFAAMFEHECEENLQNRVIITDMDADAFEELLRYIYTGKVQSLDRFAMLLLEGADKYQLESLKMFCEQYLSTHLTIKLAVNVLILADLHRANKLKTKCIDYICENSRKVKATDEWKLLSTRPQLLEELFDHFANKYNDLFIRKKCENCGEDYICY